MKNLNQASRKTLCFVLFISLWSLSSSCASRRYVRQQIQLNNCTQTVRAMEREQAILYATEDVVDAATTQRNFVTELSRSKLITLPLVQQIVIEELPPGTTGVVWVSGHGWVNAERYAEIQREKRGGR